MQAHLPEGWCTLPRPGSRTFGRNNPSTPGARGCTLPPMAAESMSAGRLHDLEADIPVRAGEHGDRVMAVEPAASESIALAGRQGAPRQLFWASNPPHAELAT